MNAHTPGRLRLFDTYVDPEIRDDNEKLVAVVLAEKANSARRLVACWNACEGIDTEDLEAGSVNIIDKLHDDAARRVMARRDELLAAMNGLLAYFESGNSVATGKAVIKTDSIEVRAAYAAIAEVKGGAA